MFHHQYQPDFNPVDEYINPEEIFGPNNIIRELLLQCETSPADVINHRELFLVSPFVCSHKRHATSKDPYLGRTKDAHYDLASDSVWNWASPKNTKESNKKFALGVVMLNFDELSEILRSGHTVKKVILGSFPRTNLDRAMLNPPSIPQISDTRSIDEILDTPLVIPTNINVFHKEPPVMPTSRFLIIDLDNEQNENVTKEELAYLESDTCHVLPGGSNKPFKYHIIKYMDAPLMSKEDYKNATKVLKEDIECHIQREITVDSALTSPHIRVFGCAQTYLSAHKYAPLNGTWLYCKEITTEHQDIIECDKYDPDGEYKQLIPTTLYELNNLIHEGNTRGLFQRICTNRINCKGETIWEKLWDNPEASITEINWNVGYTRQKYTTDFWYRAKGYVYSLIGLYLLCREKYGINYTVEHLKATIEYCVNRDIEKGNNWAERKDHLKKLYCLAESLLVDGSSPMTYSRYCEEQAKYGMLPAVKTVGRKQGGIIDPAIENVITVGIEDCKDAESISYKDRKELQTLCKEYGVSIETFKRHCGLAIKYDSKAKPKSNAGRKSHDRSHIDQNVIDGIYYYTGSKNTQDGNYCRAKGYKYRKMKQ